MPGSFFLIQLQGSGTGVFSVKFAKFLKAPFLQNTSGRLLPLVGNLTYGINRYMSGILTLSKVDLLKSLSHI